MRAAGHSYREIDKALGRFPGETQQRLELAGYGSGRHLTSHRVPEVLLAERDALIAARSQRALTQDFFGDPPTGCLGAARQDRAAITAARDRLPARPYQGRTAASSASRCVTSR
jgi:hypothetical protein